jgi:hypothetical protein
MKTIKIKLEVVHSIKGRARIKIASGFEPSVFFVVLEAGLHEIEEIKKAELSPYAQSVTIYFKADVGLDVILEKLERILADITNDPAFSQRLEEIQDALAFAGRGSMNVFVRDKILMVTRDLDHAVKRITGNAVDLKTMLPVTSLSAGLATLLLAPGLPTPTWLVLMIFGVTSFNMFKSPDSNTRAPVERPAPPGIEAAKTKLLEEGSGTPQS